VLLLSRCDESLNVAHAALNSMLLLPLILRMLLMLLFVLMVLLPLLL